MTTLLKTRVRELRALADRMEKVLEKHPDAYLSTIEHGREEWVAASVKGTAIEFTSDPRWPGRTGSISLHRYDEIEGIRVYQPPGCGRNAEYVFEELRKSSPDLYAALAEKLFG